MVDGGFEEPWLSGGIGNRVAEQLQLARTLYEGGQIDIDTICASHPPRSTTTLRTVQANLLRRHAYSGRSFLEPHRRQRRVDPEENRSLDGVDATGERSRP
jgi:hypothetical protein